MTSLTGTQGSQRADATYVLHTNDGVNIVLTERAVIPYVEILFETGSANAKYAWLNNVTAWATGSEVGDRLALNFWEVCFFFFFFSFWLWPLSVGGGVYLSMKLAFFFDPRSFHFFLPFFPSIILHLVSK